MHRAIQAFDPRTYPEQIADLLPTAPYNELVFGPPYDEFRPALTTVCPESFVASNGALANRAMAVACCAGLWLRYDFSDEAHSISQSLETPEGSYWHALVHRREPDFSNAKYWFRRVGDHPVFEPLADEAKRLAQESDAGAQAKFLLDQQTWDPLRFVDLCELALNGPPAIHDLCRAIQQREWELLFDHCFRHAVER